ncbi:MAG: adenylate/guanylate cyclase domain-containing protein [Hyphomicrobiales bacterium]|nr:adenylate/guanylate cyclase domain-containing protein [Hyphomicrobiales bacterium]
MSETRKLAAILAAVVVGYSRLMGEDEAGTARAVREHREAARPIVASHGGRIVKTTGDGLLLEFPSVVAAVECAVAIQKLMVERNAPTPEAKRILYRIGVNLGDVLIEGDDILGDGVNIAARLEGICQPGGVLISGAAYDHVRGRVDADFVDLGEKQLKNIARPVRAYSVEVCAPAQPMPPAPTKSAVTSRQATRAMFALGILAVAVAAGGWYWLISSRPAAVATGPSAPAASNAAAPAEARHLSIVVLPFTNLSGDPAQDYFADGVTENLTTELSRIRDSFVIARNTAFTYKGKSINAKEIGKELGVRYVLEGSVQRDQNRARVNAQLVDAESGAHLWADRFEEDMADLFKLQDEVVARLAGSLGYALTSAEAEKGVRSNNPDAIDLTMHGWTLIWRVAHKMNERREKFNEARALFDRALQIEPNNADALAGSAFTYFVDFFYGWSDAPTDYEAEVLGQADRAIALAPENVRAYFAKAMYLSNSRRPSEALSVADAGLAINPNFVLLYVPRIGAENALGRFKQAKADAERATRLSPRDPFIGIFHNVTGFAELGLGHVDAAVDAFHQAIDSGFPTYIVYAGLTAAYVQAGKMDEAKTALAEARRLNPKLTVKWMIERVGDFPAVSDGVRKAGLPEE